jgi:hypothetical protein
MVTHTTCTCTCTATCTCACGDMPMRTDRRVSHVRAQRVSPAEREQRPSAWRCVAFRAHVHVYLQFTRTMGITMGTNFTGRLGRRRRLYTRTFA